GPCPDGWKVPAATEAKPLTDSYGGGNGVFINTTTDKRLRFKGDNEGEYLYFAPRGFYQKTEFVGTTSRYNGSVWVGVASSSTTANAQFLYFETSKVVDVNTTGVVRSLALPVRCIQQ
ncbi:MAG: fibrobacter succinogenes major paralogous domain-containing protein, partial [Tannerellaceae bacterium]|nr:fibrobacter succinogenes major paralogous domain-containing protein [Tannerellaceae bacterium]